jgi:hypothetical protein
VPFRRLLAELVAQAPRARGAIFCDHEGESIDLALATPPPAGCGALSEYELRVCGAQFAAAWLLLLERAPREGAGQLHELRLRAAHGTVLCAVVKEGYYAALLLAEGAQAGRATLALRETAAKMALEF